MWRRREDETIDRKLLLVLARMTMRIDVKLTGVLEALGEDPDDVETDA
jgi:hypothetical protein